MTTTRTQDEIEAAIERERIEWVFGLTGGELAADNDPWIAYHISDPSECRGKWDDVLTPTLGAGIYSTRWPHRYWYEGAPEYTEREYAHVQARTTIHIDAYGSRPSAWLVDESGIWVFVEMYANSGECECPGKHEDAGPRVRPDQCGDGDREEPRCVLCEALLIPDLEAYQKAQKEDRYENGDHGYIGMEVGFEAVYVLAVHQCDECGDEIQCKVPGQFWEELCGCETVHDGCKDEDEEEAGDVSR